jgi:hypothetical protein
MALSLAPAQQHLPHALAPLPAPAVIGIGLAVLVIVLSNQAWAIALHLGVVAHEGAHALVGWGAGRKVVSMEVTPDGHGSLSGKTVTAGRGQGFGIVLTAFAGYIGPSAFGLGAAKLIAMGHIEAVLWLAVTGLAGLLLFTRNVRGLVSVLVAGALLVLVLRRGGPGAQAVTAYALTWFLLVSGVRMTLMHGSSAGDAASLKEMTHVPRLLWFAVWLAGTLGALAAGGHLLV